MARHVCEQYHADHRYRFSACGILRAGSLADCRPADDRIDAMMSRLHELHPYEVPKILAFTPQEGLTDYLGWVRDQTRP